MAELERPQTRAQVETGHQTAVDDTPTATTGSSVRHQRQLVGNVITQRAPKAAHTSTRREDPVLCGFLSSAPTCHVERRQLGLRLRARFAAVEFALAGEGRGTLPEIAERAGTSTRTLNVQFGVKDALFAFPPPELAPALFDCWRAAGDATGFEKNLMNALQRLDQNPLARTLLMGLAHLHTDLPRLSLVDGYFNAALRTQILHDQSLSRPCLSWTGYITDALRDGFQEWVLNTSKASLVSMVPNLMERLQPIAFR